MANCSKCGTAVPAGATACPSCGEAQASAPAAGATASSGLTPNIAGALAYIPIVAILWLVLEPYNKDRFIRFHSFQSLAVAVCWFVLNIVLLIIPVIGWILLPLVGLGVFIVWLICIFKAFNNDKFNVPVIGDWAAKQAG